MKEYIRLIDSEFPLTIIEHEKNKLGQIFESHCHKNHLQLFYLLEGEAILYCDEHSYTVSSDDVLLVNCNELHGGESLSKQLKYYVIRFDLQLLNSYKIATLNEKYLKPLLHGEVTLERLPKEKEIQTRLDQIIECYQKKKFGYEMQLIEYTFGLLGVLLEKHIQKNYTMKEIELLMCKRKRLADVFKYINEHYQEEITLAKVADIAHVSEAYLCRLFKKCTGHSLVDYINQIRIEKAAYQLDQGLSNVTEAASACGFNDMNYFSRVFKKYMGQSPVHYIHNNMKYRI